MVLILQSFRKYMTFKKDYNDMLIYILRGLVNNALQFEGIATGSISNLTHIDVKVDDLYAKVINTRPMFVFSMLR
jgi:DNA replication licensing factor MCM2